VGYTVRQFDFQPRRSRRRLVPNPTVNIYEVEEGVGTSLTTAFRYAAELANWPRGLILEPVAHEVAGG
jgi:hypothetical protein